MKRSKPDSQLEWALQTRLVKRVDYQCVEPALHSDTLALETPVALVYNGISYAVMMASPADLEDFALGFSLSEGIIDQASQMYECELGFAPGQPSGLLVSMQIAQSCFVRLKQRQRNLTGTSGCGLCGLTSLQNLAPQPPQLAGPQTLQFNLAAIQSALLQAPEWQVLNQLTGACHAAASFTTQGNILLLREDVGRHNALDKLIGAHQHHAIKLATTAVFLSSRASFELISKAVTMSIPLLVSVSAPTNLAVELALQHGLTLCGFAREQGLVVYCDPLQRVVLPDS